MLHTITFYNLDNRTLTPITILTTWPKLTLILVGWKALRIFGRKGTLLVENGDTVAPYDIVINLNDVPLIGITMEETPDSPDSPDLAFNN